MNYFDLPEILLKPLERTEAITMFIAVTQLDNLAVFWLPTNDPRTHITDNMLRFLHFFTAIDCFASSTELSSKM
ncbi:hypothetical protein [Pantoea agglomerans]|uniref:hypothetical protein n=1 Tax=Enterobacter agglomerans TaxID=549 RepID=UPI00045C90F9|nr:hypothetical protein [Pantoea agglomerans]KDA93491.1 hypothetical protein T296_16895 [Pantoea agglomerans Eh318]WNK50269.1 hypothetical protein RM153_08020 [Pantoea agglomerans]